MTSDAVPLAFTLATMLTLTAPASEAPTGSAEAGRCSVARAAAEYDEQLSRLAVHVGYSGPPMCQIRLYAKEPVADAAAPLAHCRQQWSALLRAGHKDPHRVRRAEIERRIQTYLYLSQHNEETRTFMLAQARCDLQELIDEARVRRWKVEALLGVRPGVESREECAPKVEQSWRETEEIRQRLAAIAAEERANERVLLSEVSGLTGSIQVMEPRGHPGVPRQKADLEARSRVLQQYQAYLACVASD